MTDAELAAAIASAAGRLLLDLRASGLWAGKALGKVGDRLANELIVAALRDHRPEDGLLSEESADDARRLSIDRVWIVDPLDGTREYAEGRSDWAVHVALAVRGVPVVGAVALPAEDIVLRSDRPPAPAPPADRIRILVSRTRPAAEAEALAALLSAELVPMGSAGAKAAAVALGRGDIYVHSGGQYEWDNCAPAAVAIAAGLHAARLDGSALSYNCHDPRLPDLLICPNGLVDRVRAALAGSATEGPPGRQ